MEFGKAAQEWFESTLHLKPRTRSSSRHLLDLRILPRWKHVPMGKVSAMLQEWITELAGSGLAASQVRQTVYVFSSVCQHGIRTGRLQANPVTGIKLPKLVSAW
ncbi:hypothetical protein ABN034_14230 [Actinopolymorpha sp. B11F2]|uniref:hypothetical protein n=1 Tax=Actinopolymorpha sp. B11F2 TaxID=3160862 RepID=UPI0032E3E507